eukprot:Opistho-2@56026
MAPTITTSLAVVVMAACVATALSVHGTKIIGHRGDPYYVPGHTLASYSIAIAEGVDFVEPDVVMTRDFRLICRHDLDLEQSTDVGNRTEFADRRRSLYAESVAKSIVSWWVEDFTLEEVRSLRCVQRVSNPAWRDPYFNGMFSVPTFEETIQFVVQRTKETGRPIGLIPELKSPYHYSRVSAENGLSDTYFADEFLRILGEYGYLGDNPPGPLIVQCAESRTLRYLRSKHPSLQTLQLVFGDGFEPDSGYAHDTYLTRTGMDDLKSFASAIGPWKEFLAVGKGAQWWFGNMSGLVPPELAGRLRRNGTVSQPYVRPEDVVRELHKRGIAVYPWTFRNPLEDASAATAAAAADGDVAAEVRRFLSMGVDGIFVEKALPSLYVRDVQASCANSCPAPDDGGGDGVVAGNSCIGSVSSSATAAIGVSCAVGGAFLMLFVQFVVARIRMRRNGGGGTYMRT